MQGLILAAGMGKRLGKYTEDQTKCMVKVNNKTLIEYALDSLISAGIKSVILVVGYKAQKLKDFLGNSYKSIEITYVDNEIYDKTNNIYSLWLAKEYLVKDDTLLLESDLIFEDSIIKDLIKDASPSLAVVAKYEPWMDGTVTLLDKEDNITSFIPKANFNWNHIENYYKTVNIYKFSKEFSSKYYTPFLEAYISALGNNEYYEQVLKVIASLDDITLKALTITHKKWYEIDDIQDLDIASIMFSAGKDEVESLQKRYGGYWRFPKLKDFCYLVNPYFPCGNLISELKSSFNDLLTQYPSGLNTQNLLAARLFDCDEKQILVGNGAAELIKASIEMIEGKIGIILPTFNEYGERAGKDRLKKFYPKYNDFSYTVDELIEFSKDINALVLINPDNPSGHFLLKEDIFKLLNFLRENNKYLILDESFVDFSGENKWFSMIQPNILDEYKNLIVIKSISKSYGVPGLRLGVVASGDEKILSKIRKGLSIWNINSFAEYFLQIIYKYKKDYLIGCKKIENERNRFFNELNKIDYLRIIPSYSNYFLCEVISKYSSSELTEILMSKFDIFIKDCSVKDGFNNKNYIRIAVRDKNDNDYLIQKLLTL